MLLKTNKLSILQKLFKKIVIPQAVYLEITAKEQEKLIFDNLDWIETKNIIDTEVYSLLEKLIDKGEAEAIILAKELKTCLLADDAKARSTQCYLT